jgi:iron complex outermembrane receptor protein
MINMVKFGLAIIILVYLSFAAIPCRAAGSDSDSRLEDLNLEELMDVEVVSPSRRKQSLENIAGSYTILTEEDIRRSGAKSIPEALQTVPGVIVTRTDTDKWAIGIRGFKGVFNSKQLILIDNRPITSPYFAEVLWGTQGLPIEMVKQIEVIRGPWTSLWGAESFNGFINIITKHAKELEGLKSVTTVGSDGVSELLIGGSKISDNGNFAVYGKGGYEAGKNYTVFGHPEKGSRDWTTGTVGVRGDWENAFTDELSFQGAISHSKITEQSPPGNPFSADRDKNDVNGFAQFVWDRSTGVNSGIQFRSSYSRTIVTLQDLEGNLNTFDGELVYSGVQTGAHLITAGAGGRYFWEEFEQGKFVSVRNANFSRFDVSSFLQDRITLIEDELFLTLGMKLDYVEDGEVSPQPTARLLYTKDKQEYWLALSYANRYPSDWVHQGHYDVMYNGQRYFLDSTADLDNEELTSVEAGYRKIFDDDLKIDLSVFFNNYDQMVTMSFDPATRTASPVSSLEGITYGSEFALDWQALEWLILRPSVSVTLQDFPSVPGDGPGFSPPLNSPVYSYKLQAIAALSDSLELDLFSSYLNSLDDRDLSTGFDLSARLEWKASDKISLELIGSGLLNGVNDANYVITEPAVSMRLTWDF